MTAFELTILSLGLAGLGLALWSIRYLGIIWTHHLEVLQKRDEQMLLELMRCNDRLVSIQESFQNLYDN